MLETVRSPRLLVALFTLGLTTAQAQPALLRKDLQVAGQYGTFEIQTQRRSIALGDYTGDDRPDLVVSSSAGIDILPNTGGDNFVEPIHVGCLNGAFACGSPGVAAEFNEDGRLDLVVPSSASLIGHVVLGRDDGTFYSPREVIPRARKSEYIAKDHQHDRVAQERRIL